MCARLAPSLSTNVAQCVLVGKKQEPFPSLLLGLWWRAVNEVHRKSHLYFLKEAAVHRRIRKSVSRIASCTHSQRFRPKHSEGEREAKRGEEKREGWKERGERRGEGGVGDCRAGITEKKKHLTGNE